MRRAIAFLVLLVLAGCGLTPSPSSGPPVLVDTTSRALLDEHGHTPAGATTVSTVTIGDTTDMPWLLYLEASQAIGLDFSALEGGSAELRATPVAAGEGTATAYVLVRGGAAIGAWLDPGEMSSGVVSLGERR
jgi:hypothetical protein